jgi:16S rRNA processing protein RimM
VHDLIGMVVATDAGEPLGTLEEVLFTAANEVYVIAGPSGEILIPALRSVVLDVNLAERRMTVRLPEGLLD